MSKNIFNSVKMTRPRNNRFDLSHDVKLTCNMGELIPTTLIECVPDDKFNIGCEALLRFQPMLAPIMHRVDVTMHYFFVPNRILWDNWENFITQTPVGGLIPAAPRCTIGTGNYTRLDNYLGIPRIGEPNISTEVVSLIPYAVYNKIWNDYYRDQNLQDEIRWKLVDGDDTADFPRSILRRAWEHDYFTSALPFAQKGPAVPLPVGNFEDVPIRRDGVAGSSTAWTADVVAPSGAATVNVDGQETDSDLVEGTELYAQTSEMDNASTTINDLRLAVRIQEWLEKMARGGSRYFETILSHFGLRSPDARLQRPEYITGIKSPVQISEVLNNTGTESLPQGNMAGHGISFTSGKYGNYHVKEHGYIMGIMSVMPKTAYQQGIEKHWTKFNPYDYYWPSFAHLGEQEVKNKEVFAFQGLSGEDTFGYVPRYAEYKFKNNMALGDLQQNLDFWHLGRIFESAPALNEEFIQCVPRDNIFAVTDVDTEKLIAHVYHKISAVRPMPKYGTPTF